MFGNNQQDDLSNNTSMDQVASEIGDSKQDNQTSAPAFGLGSNPSTFTPTQNPVPQSTPPGPANNSSAPQPTSAYGGQTTGPTHTDGPSSNLDEIKTQALEQLSPLISKLEQSPEEKYKTLMMLIQASDNHDLIQEAYAAANAIEDEKVRAEALLSIINEINYFTQQSHS